MSTDETHPIKTLRVGVRQSNINAIITRIAYVGTGSRVRTFIDPVAREYADTNKIVAFCDLNLKRANFHLNRLRDLFGYEEVPVYASVDFIKMLEEVKPDRVVVCTVDSEHDYYIIESLKAGCDVITEKPMTTTAGKCQSIMDAISQSPGKVQVAFNYRWSPAATTVKKVLESNVIGKVHQVTMEYCLNTSHGADYFRRWHAHKENSGGLLVHKSTHHFDLVNWWLDGIPKSVFAKGGLRFYGLKNAIERGDEKYTQYERYHGHVGVEDPFAFIYNDENDDEIYNRHLYLESEEGDGYIRDRNVFSPDIDIEDVMNVMVEYRHGALLNYTLNAFSPTEGYRICFVGDRGRIEFEEDHGNHMLDDNGMKIPVNEHLHGGGHRLTVYPHFKASYQVDIPLATGGHGGADPLLQQQLFEENPPKDPYGRHAGHEQGAASILTGIAANTSMSSHKEIQLLDLVCLNPNAIHLSELT